MKTKVINSNPDELHACAMTLLEMLIEQNRSFTGEEAVTLSLGVIMPDESKKRINISIYEK